MRVHLQAAALLLFLAGSFQLFSQVASPNSYSNATFGISFNKPDGWFFDGIQEETSGPASGEMAAEEFQKLVQKYSARPLVFATKHKEPFDDLNPSFSIMVFPLIQSSGEFEKELLAAIAEQGRSKGGDFKILVPVKNSMFAGQKAGYVKMSFSFKGPNGEMVPELTEVWAIARSNHVVVASVSLRQDEKSGRREEFREMLDSVQFGPGSVTVHPDVSSKSQEPFLKASKQVPARMEWNREIVARKDGAVRFVVKSPKPFAVTLVTESAYKDIIQKRVKRRLGREELLISMDCKEPVFERTVTVKPGSYHFILENQSDEAVQIQLECYEVK